MTAAKERRDRTEATVAVFWEMFFEAIPISRRSSGESIISKKSAQHFAGQHAYENRSVTVLESNRYLNFFPGSTV